LSQLAHNDNERYPKPGATLAQVELRAAEIHKMPDDRSEQRQQNQQTFRQNQQQGLSRQVLATNPDQSSAGRWMEQAKLAAWEHADEL
jgi:hypothetical protein